MEDRPNVLLLVLDTVRADAAPPLSPREDTPFLWEMAAESLVFPQAFSTSDWTLPAHASMLTGQYTSRHGLNYGVGYEAMRERQGLAHRLKAAGYATWGLSNNPWFGDLTGLDGGFEEFRAYRPRERFWLTPVNYFTDRVYANFGRAPVDLRKRLALAYEWVVKGRLDDGCARAFSDLLGLVDGARGGPWFAMVNVIEAHGPYIPPEPFRHRMAGDLPLGDLLAINQDSYNHHFGLVRMTDGDFEALRRLYRAEVAYLDHMLRALLRGLERRGVLDGTVLVVTSDHGENIGDHGLMEHRWCVYDSLIHVPLLVRLPPALSDVGAGVDPRGLVQLCDLYPTIAHLAGLDVREDDGVQGVDMLASRPGRDMVLAEMVPRQLPREALPRHRWERFEPIKVAARTPEAKLVWSSDGQHELYRLAEDPGELRNVFSEGDGVARSLLAEVEDRCDLQALEDQSRTPDRDVEDRSLRDRLRALGYMS